MYLYVLLIFSVILDTCALLESKESEAPRHFVEFNEICYLTDPNYSVYLEGALNSSLQSKYHCSLATVHARQSEIALKKKFRGIYYSKNASSLFISYTNKVHNNCHKV